MRSGKAHAIKNWQMRVGEEEDEENTEGNKEGGYLEELRKEGRRRIINIKSRNIYLINGK